MITYKTVRFHTECRLIERKSKFIGNIKSVDSEYSANKFIDEIRSEYWDASHNVYAYVLRAQNKQKYSDDAEPRGTAGMPVLSVIKNHNLADVAIVVTRYFGGVLLGKNGLIRAYSNTAGLAIKSSEIITMGLCSIFEAECAYEQYQKLLKFIYNNSGMIIDSNFLEKVQIKFSLLKGREDKFIKELNSNMSSDINLKFISEEYREVKI